MSPLLNRPWGRPRSPRYAGSTAPRPRASRVERALLIGLCCCTPGIFGFASCGHAYRSVLPTGVCQGRASCSPFMGHDATTDALIRFGEARSDGVVALGLANWAAVEVCGDPAQLATTMAQVQAYDLQSIGESYVVAATHPGCYYDLSGLQFYLDLYCVSQSEGPHVDGLIVLAPIFGAAPSVPPYLAPPANTDIQFSDPTVVQAFDNLWDAVSGLLSQPKYQKGPSFVVSIGNEVNTYLSNPPSATVRQARWDDYTSFFTTVRKHIDRNRPDGIPLAFGVTTTWYGFHGIGDTDFWIDYDPDAENIARINGLADVPVYTYYPPSANLVADALAGQNMDQVVHDLVAQDFATMRLIGGHDNVFIQEAGFPSDFLTAGFGVPNTTSPTGLGDQDLESLQKQFTLSISVARAELDFTSGPVQNPINGLSYFSEHDFSVLSESVFPEWTSTPNAANPSADLTCADCEALGFTCVNGGTGCQAPMCDAEGGCPATLFCCHDATKCELNRCIFGSPCAQVTAPAPGQGVSCAADSDCTNGVCEVDQICRDAAFRSSLCSVGLVNGIDSAGNFEEKPAWTEWVAAQSL